MKSQINPASFTLSVNQKPMKSTISPVSFTFPINQQPMKSTINQKVMKILDPEKTVDLAPQMIELHLQQAENWAFQLAKLANPHDREIIRRQFEHQCQQTVYKLRGELQWLK